jgi:hypothetical protein
LIVFRALTGIFAAAVIPISFALIGYNDFLKFNNKTPSLFCSEGVYYYMNNTLTYNALHG